MTRRSAAGVEAIRRIVERESRSDDDPRQRAEAAVRVHDRLTEHLSPLVGSAGARALVARSLALTRPELSCFDEVLVTDGGRPALPAGEQLLACFSRLSPEATAAAATALLATLVGLLTNLIGDALVSQLLERAFPVTDPNIQKEKSQHRKDLREYEIDEQGRVVIGETLRGYDGLLTGSPARES